MRSSTTLCVLYVAICVVSASPDTASLLPAILPRSIGNWAQLLALRNKEDYARAHNYGLYWTLNHFGNRIKGPWNKVAALLHLAETLDESRYQWLMWLDYDTLFGNLTTEIPFDRYDGTDLVLWATKEGVIQGDASKLNSGVILLRISDWSRTFLRALLKLGLDWRYSQQSRDFLMEHVVNFSEGLYEQNGIAYLFKKHKEWRDKLFDEHWDPYVFHALFAHIPYQDPPDTKPLLVVHWAGCQHIDKRYDYRKCMTTFAEIWTTTNTQAVRMFNTGAPLDNTSLLQLLESSDPAQWMDHDWGFER